MLRENCHPYQENLAAYSLGALDADEIIALESHLVTCKDCQVELTDYQEITAGLLQSIPSQTPPSSLRRKLMSRLPSAQHPTPGLFARFFGHFSLGQFAALAILTFLIVLNLSSNRQLHDLQQQQAAILERLSTERTAVAMLAYPGTQALEVSTDIQNLTGSILVDKNKNTAVLVVQNLPALEAGKTYQVWLIDAKGDRTSGGLFVPTEQQEYTTAAIQAAVPIGKFVGVGVTVEPWGGSDQPTGERVLRVSW